MLAEVAQLVTLSEIDRQRFDVVTARAEEVTVATLPAVLKQSAALGADLVIARCDAADLPTVQGLEAASLRLMDAQVRFGCRVVEESASTGGDTAVRAMRPGEEEFIVQTAREAFTGYAGHYHADPRLPAQLCDEVYPSWARRCCSGEAAHHVVVAEVEGRPAGFSAFDLVTPAEARLVLGAVAPWARGHHLYALMARAGMRWSASVGAARMTAVTQVTNLPAQRSWIAAAMRPEAVWYTFHGWL